MKPTVKNAVESALVALAAGVTCLWLLIGAANADDADVAKITLFALGLAASAVVHLVFMAQAVHRAGRPLWRWVAALVLLFPLGSIVLLVMLYTAHETEAQATTLKVE